MSAPWEPIWVELDKLSGGGKDDHFVWAGDLGIEYIWAEAPDYILGHGMPEEDTHLLDSCFVAAFGLAMLTNASAEEVGVRVMRAYAADPRTLAIGEAMRAVRRGYEIGVKCRPQSRGGLLPEINGDMERHLDAAWELANKEISA